MQIICDFLSENVGCIGLILIVVVSFLIGFGISALKYDVGFLYDLFKSMDYDRLNQENRELKRAIETVERVRNEKSK